MKTDLIFLLVIAVYIGYYLCKKESFSSESVEGFSAMNEARQAVREIYNADIEAIRNLSEVSKRLQAGGLTHPGRLTVNAGGDHIPILAQSNTDSHILLRTKNDGNKDSYLINRDGHLRVHMANVGDVFGVNHDGHLYNEHHGDHVAHHVGRGGNPYITLSRAGQWGNSSWYLQNVHNDHPHNSTFRIGKHDVGSKVDIGSNGAVNSVGGFIANNAIQNGWISGNFGVGGKDRVVIGNLENTATVGAHNNALNAWTTLNLRGEQVNLVTHNGRINLGNGWNIRTGDGHFRLYHGNDQQFVVHNPHAGAEWGNVVWGKRMRTDGDLRVEGSELRVGKDGQFAQITLPQFHIQSHWQHDAVRVTNRINRAAPGWFTDIGYQWGGGRRI
jgi:uncharacterized protein (UPF0333 family)